MGCAWWRLVCRCWCVCECFPVVPTRVPGPAWGCGSGGEPGGNGGWRGGPWPAWRGWAPVPSLPYAVDESLPECTLTLVRGVAGPLYDGEVVVRSCFVLHRWWEGVIVPLLVVRSVFEIQLLADRGGGNCHEPDSVGMGDALRA